MLVISLAAIRGNGSSPEGVNVAMWEKELCIPSQKVLGDIYKLRRFTEV